MKFAPQSFINAKTATFDKVKRQMALEAATFFKEHSSDMADSITHMEVYDITTEQPQPEVAPLEGTDQAALDKQAALQKMLDFKNNERVKLYLKREMKLKENLRTLYSWILTKWCTPLMQDRVRAHPDFATEIENNPIKLLKAIEELMHDPIRKRYSFAQATYALIRYLTIKQDENEKPVDYASRYKSYHNVVVSLFGEGMLTEFVKQTSDYKGAATQTDAAALQQVMIDGAFEQWTSYLILRGAYPRNMVPFPSYYNSVSPWTRTCTPLQSNL